MKEDSADFVIKALLDSADSAIKRAEIMQPYPEKELLQKFGAMYGITNTDYLSFI